jgi:hypothetical protein
MPCRHYRHPEGYGQAAGKKTSASRTVLLLPCCLGADEALLNRYRLGKMPSLSMQLANGYNLTNLTTFVQLSVREMTGLNIDPALEPLDLLQVLYILLKAIDLPKLQLIIELLNN